MASAGSVADSVPGVSAGSVAGSGEADGSGGVDGWLRMIPGPEAGAFAANAVMEAKAPTASRALSVATEMSFFMTWYSFCVPWLRDTAGRC